MVPHLAVVSAWAVGGWAVVGVASLSALAGLYLLTLAVAARLTDAQHPSFESDHPRLAVVVPAHDECHLVGRCVSTLLAQEYPEGALDVVVVADNCTDDTGRLAAEAGARVFVRDDPGARGKGQALRWAFDRLLAEQVPWEAVVVVDADSVAHPRLIAGLSAHLRGGAEVVQAEYLALQEDGSMMAELRAAAFMLFHRVRFSGRAALGLPCTLVGNGMLFSRRILEQHPWNAFTSVEDLEYSIDLRLAGVKTVFARDALVRAPVSTRGAAARTQRLRWEGGRLQVLRTRLPKLLVAALCRGRWSQLDAAIDLLVPPLGVLAAVTSAVIVATGCLVARHVLPGAVMVPSVVAAASISGFVLVGFWAGGVPATTYRALALAPAMVASEFASRLRLAGGLRADQWERTARAQLAEAEPISRGDRGRRILLEGVPIDPLCMDGALDVLRSAIRSRRMTQLCTVNLDFLANSCRRPDVRSVLQHGDLNLADGAPVVWLAKLLGEPIPERVAGSDLVPRLMEVAAEEGARVFLLGGEHGVAGEAARRMVRRYPALVIAGVYEPPREESTEADDETIAGVVSAARADILLVALGHPRQDCWIARNRPRLGVSVAMGVGCTFDLLAGRRSRAPRWMGACGLEWLYRLVHEPRRLGARYAGDAWCLLTLLVPHAIAGRLRPHTNVTDELPPGERRPPQRLSA